MGIFMVRMIQLADAILSHWMWALGAFAVSGSTADDLLAEAARREAVEATGADAPAAEGVRPAISQGAAKTLH